MLSVGGTELGVINSTVRNTERLVDNGNMSRLDNPFCFKLDKFIVDIFHTNWLHQAQKPKVISHNLTRMHSSRMRTVRNSSRLPGGVPAQGGTPRAGTPHPGSRYTPRYPPPPGSRYTPP